MVSDDRPPHSRVPERIRRRSHIRKRPVKSRRSAAKDQAVWRANSTKRAAKASLRPSGQQNENSRRIVQPSMSMMRSSPLRSSSTIDATDTMAMASLLRTKLLMLSVLPSCTPHAAKRAVHPPPRGISKSLRGFPNRFHAAPGAPSATPRA